MIVAGSIMGRLKRNLIDFKYRALQCVSSYSDDSGSFDSMERQVIHNIKMKLDSFHKLSREDIDYIYRVLVLLHDSCNGSSELEGKTGT